MTSTTHVTIITKPNPVGQTKAHIECWECRPRPIGDNGDGDEIGAVLSLGSGPDFYTTFGLAVLIFGHDFATSSRPRRHQLPACNLKVAGSNAVPGRRITKSARSIDSVKLHIGLYYTSRLLRAKKVGNPRLFSPLMDDLSRTALHMPYAFGRRLDRRFGTNGNCGLDISGHNRRRRDWGMFFHHHYAACPPERWSVEVLVAQQMRHSCSVPNPAGRRPMVQARGQRVLPRSARSTG